MLQKATDAKENSEIENDIEKIKLQVLASYDNNSNIDKSKLVSNLTSIGASVEGTDFPFLATLNRSECTIYSNGETNTVSKDAMNIKKVNSIASSTTITAEEKMNFYRGLYGKSVNYPIKITTELTNGNGEETGIWRIFYADESNIYLIADSRIKVPYNSGDTAQNVFLSGYITKSQWCTIFSNNGSDGIFLNYLTSNIDYNRTSPTNITQYASEIVLKKLNNSYYSKGFSPTSDSLRAVISMLDTDVWSVYKDSKYAQYAIGGPSIEMLCNSYSQSHDLGIETEAFHGDQYGYKVKRIGEDEYKYGTDNNFLSPDLNGIYSNKCWLCSPSARTGYARIMCIGPYRGINDNYHNQDNYLNTGFRPLVCLKSNIQLEESTDPKYDYILK